ncbi:hypothetical protein HMF8227_00732 [Saliniradius amylolyticus]|uniref:Sulfotransferase family protein n=1 Tax=Saliniradius amylolyticus TaxID=2183582 RepID=A0A2S2E0R2_9ALTE|nr:sulfotransferase family 2 domain-containing protein [Saliniradius amylolyticus]AWL11228.1 hypothetical protein HMF8227_00732 [Saliniradius amylolyticus]
MFNRLFKRHYPSVFFVHIPKTAGTSFRHALERQVPLWKDYGEESKVTSDEVRKKAYAESDFYTLKDMVFASKRSLCGHIPARKYSDFYPSHKVVTFLRHPFQQVLSHYNHKVKYDGLNLSLEKYLVKSCYRNIQSRYLKGLPLSLYGFIGITERYVESVEYFNELYGSQVKALERNQNHSPSISSQSVGESLKARLLALNEEDLICYGQAKALLEQRLSHMEHHSVNSWVYASVNINNNNRLAGCAFYHGGTQPVRLVVKVGNEVLQTLTADNYFTGFPRWCFPRHRYVGFQSEKLPRTEGDVVSLEVKSTGQLLFRLKIE